MTPTETNVSPIIRALARKHGIDPQAAIAVAMGEGGLVNRDGDRGDGGRSFGPFQLYERGELPRQYVGRPDIADQWAWSPAGIEHALSRMAETGARGLTGSRAVETIIRKFERPADPDSSVRNALGRLGSIPAGQTMTAARPVRMPQSTVAASASPTTGFAGMLLARSAARRGRTISPILAGLLQNTLNAPQAPAAPVDPQPPDVAPLAAGGGPYPFNPLRGAYKPLGAPGHGTHSRDEGPDNWQSDFAWDFGANPGTPVYATEDGIVDPSRYGPLSSSGRFGGHRLTIDTPGVDSFYQHLAPNLAVKPGQRVTRGQLLGYVGDVPGLRPHLHYARSVLP